MYSFIGTLKSSGKENLWLEKEESRIGEIQVCAGLQDQGVEETDWAPREWYQTNEGPNPRGMEPLHSYTSSCFMHSFSSYVLG